MEYMQMTLNDWLEMKQSLERELSNLKTGFIRVGYVLRRIDESKGYEQDGYKSVAEFAKEEYGLSASTVSRFMAINERFSLGGYSERLDPQYIGFHQSIMGEMLGLPDNDLELITPETSRQVVRELKQFNRQEPEHGIADDLRELLENYFRENKQELNELYSASGQATKEVLNPSGNKVLRKGMYMLFFYPDCVKTKKFGGETSSYSWDEFRELIDEVFASSAGPDTYGNYFNVPSPELEEEEQTEDQTEEHQPEGSDTEPEEETTPPDDTDTEPEEPDTAEGGTDDIPAEPAEAEEGDGSAPEEDSPAEGKDEPDQEEDDAAEDAPSEEAMPAEGGAEQEPADIMPLPEEQKPEPAPIAPAQKPQESTTFRDVKGLMKGLEEAFRKKDWDRMLRLIAGLEPAVRKLQKEDG